jgi:hypothetical protein
MVQYILKGGILATEEMKLEESPLFLEILHDASEIYGKQPYKKKNGLSAAIAALDKHGVYEDPLRGRLRSLVCSRLGRAGSDGSFFSRNQLDLFPIR